MKTEWRQYEDVDRSRRPIFRFSSFLPSFFICSNVKNIMLRSLANRRILVIVQCSHNQNEEKQRKSEFKKNSPKYRV